MNFDQKLLNSIRAIQNPATMRIDSRALSSLTHDFDNSDEKNSSNENGFKNEEDSQSERKHRTPLPDIQGPVDPENPEEMIIFEGDSPPVLPARKEIRISDMPIRVRDTASRLDGDGDGALSAEDVARAINDLTQKRKDNILLQKVILFFAALTGLLIAAIFGASITAARLSKEISVDSRSGFAYYAKDPLSGVVKTSEATVFAKGVTIQKMSDEELQGLREIHQPGKFRFSVRGHAWDEDGDTVLLLVEGGTIRFDTCGIVDATGDARLLLEAIYGQDAFVAGRKYRPPCLFDNLVAASSADSRYHNTDLVWEIGLDSDSSWSQPPDLWLGEGDGPWYFETGHRYPGQVRRDRRV